MSALQGALRISVCLPEGAQAWALALRAALPQALVEAWQPGAPKADYAVLWHPPAAFFAEQTKLRAAFSAGAGVDGFIDRVPPGLPLVRIEDAGMGALMAEYVLHALLRWHRGFDRYAAQRQWQPLKPERREDWTVGLLGYGVLGQAVARAVRALGFPTQAWVRTARAAEIPLFAGPAQLPDFLATTRVLVALLPLTAATRGLLNRERLSLLPAGAYVINIARGDLLVQPELLALLDQGHLAGAQLDVCTPEPLPPEHPLWQHAKVQITPHIAALTPRGPAMAQVAEKILRLERGEAISGLVGPAGY